MENPDIARIHDFWYSRPPVEWFMPPEGFDSACATQFGGLVQDARDGNLDQWTSDRNGSLAIIILLDQFSRNIHRDTPNAFSADPKALDIAIRAIAKGWDGEVPMAQAVTFVSESPSERALMYINAQAVLTTDAQRKLAGPDSVLSIFRETQDAERARQRRLEVSVWVYKSVEESSRGNREIWSVSYQEQDTREGEHA